MRIESLILFLSVVEHESISHAAKQAYISQQGASAIIKSLEHELGVTLFDRSNNVLTLTEAGRRIVKDATSVVEAYRRLQTTAALGNDAVGGDQLRIVTTPFTIHALSPAFDAYLEASESTNSLIITEQSLFDIVDQFPDLDPEALYIVNIPTFMKAILHRVGSAFSPLVVSELLLCCSPGSPLAECKTIGDAELSGLQIACYNEDLVKRLVRHLIKSADGAKISMQTTNVELIQRAVNEQHMAGFTDSLSLFLGGQQDRDVFIPLACPILFATGVLGSSGNEQADRFAAFFSRYLETVCADYMRRYRIEVWIEQALEAPPLDSSSDGAMGGIR